MHTRYPPRRRLRYALEGAAAHIFVFSLRLMPLRLASAYGGWLGRLIGPRSKASRYATANLTAAFPDYSSERIASIMRGMWDNLGRTACEYPHLHKLWEPELFERIAGYGFGTLMAAAERGEPVTVQGRWIEVVGIEHAIDCFFNPQPRIFFSGHFGNWEIMPLFATNLGMRVDVIYRRPNNPHVDKLLIKMRSGHGGLVPKGILGAVRARRVLDEGGILGLLVDQKHNQGVSIPFFGRPAMTTPMVARLALQYRCPVHGAWVQRLERGRFRVTITPPLDIPDTGDRKADVVTILTEINRIVEGWVRERPDQWMWAHRRWPK